MAVPVSEKKLSLGQFLELEERHPERRFKPAANGAVIEMSPGRSHGFVQGNICGILLNWLKSEALSGYGAGTEIMHDLDGWLCVPDVAVLPVEGEDYPREAPLLAVEIESKSNTRSELRAKAGATWSMARGWCGWSTRRRARWNSVARMKNCRRCPARTCWKVARRCRASASA